MRSIARWCVTHRRLALAAWLVALIGLAALSKSVGSSYNDSFSLNGTQSFQALQLLEHAAPKASGDREQIVIAVKNGRVTDPAVKTRAEAMLARVAKLPDVASITSPYSPAGTGQISRSGQVAFATVTMSKQASKFTTTQAKQFVNTAKAGAGGGLQVAVGGQVAEQTIQPNVSSAGFGAFAALIVLFIVFGSLLAAVLPLITAGFALGTGTATVGLLSHVIHMASFSSELSLLIGLGVGVDYALFIVTRYRQGLQRGKSVEDAIVDAVDTSGRAVHVRRDNRLHRAARHVRAWRQLPLRRRDRRLDRGGLHSALGPDPAPGPARVLRDTRTRPARPAQPRSRAS